MFDDEAIVSAVGATLARSDRFWALVESTAPARAAAAELVPCEGKARVCLTDYVELAREALAATGDPSAAHMRVLQHRRRLTWGSDDEPLTERARHARFLSPQFGARLEMLERIIEGRCAEPNCDRIPSRDAKRERRRLPRCVCCPDHERTLGDFYRRRVRLLLADVQAIIERAERGGGQALPLPR